ncbi:MAG: DUF1285 domain-containing protein [Chrysiogenetes bacterium]|nr:DUF1285 domain-containing protein [Chrysiogenetes bacterium]
MIDDEEQLPPGITPEMLAHFRNLISMDKECNWFYDGRPILHAKTLKVLNESMSRNDEGKLIVTIGNAWSYVHCEDAPYGVRAVRDVVEGGALVGLDLILTDQSTERLDPATLAVGEGNVLYCRVKNGKEEARFFRPAYYQLTQHLDEKDGEIVLRLGANSSPFGKREKPVQ